MKINKIIIVLMVMASNLSLFSMDSDPLAVSIKQIRPIWQSMNAEKKAQIAQGFRNNLIKYVISREKKDEIYKFVDVLAQNKNIHPYVGSLDTPEQRKKAINSMVDLLRRESLDNNPEFYKKQFESIFGVENADIARAINDIFVNNNLNNRQAMTVLSALELNPVYLGF